MHTVFTGLGKGVENSSSYFDSDAKTLGANARQVAGEAFEYLSKAALAQNAHQVDARFRHMGQA